MRGPSTIRDRQTGERCNPGIIKVTQALQATRHRPRMLKPTEPPYTQLEMMSRDPFEQEEARRHPLAQRIPTRLVASASSHMPLALYLPEGISPIRYRQVHASSIGSKSW